MENNKVTYKFQVEITGEFNISKFNNPDTFSTIEDEQFYTELYNSITDEIKDQLADNIIFKFEQCVSVIDRFITFTPEKSKIIKL